VRTDIRLLSVQTEFKVRNSSSFMTANLYVMWNIMTVFEHIKMNFPFPSLRTPGNLWNKSSVQVTVKSPQVRVINKNLINSNKTYGINSVQLDGSLTRNNRNTSSSSSSSSGIQETCLKIWRTLNVVQNISCELIVNNYLFAHFGSMVYKILSAGVNKL